MSTTRPQNPVSRLNPISDADAVGAVSPQTLADLAAAIVAMPAPPQARGRGGFSGASRYMRRPVFTLAAGAAALCPPFEASADGVSLPGVDGADAIVFWSSMVPVISTLWPRCGLNLLSSAFSW